MRLITVCLLIFCLAGCRTAPNKPEATRQETVSSLTTVTRGLTNKPVDEATLKAVARDAAGNPDTRSALRSINQALSPQYRVKYCPVDGQRFSADMDYCPIHHVKLKWVE